MEIKVLGTGCPSCKTLEHTTIQAVQELELDAEIIKVEDMMEIINHNVMRTPALVIDGKVVSAGKKLSLQEVKELLTQK